MNGKAMWILLALIPIGLLIPVSIGAVRNYEIKEKGQLVTVIVTKVPNNPRRMRGRRNRGAMQFFYNNEAHVMMVTGQVDDFIHEGDSIKLQHLKYEDRDWFTFPNDNQFEWAMVLIIMLLSGFASCLYYYFKS